jgi:excisionase family DNA binding protein
MNLEGAPYTMAEAMAMLDCAEDAVVARIGSGELAAVKFGRSWIFPRAAFHEALNDIAREEASRRRAEHDAKRQTRTAIRQAKTPARGRARTPPALPSLP